VGGALFEICAAQPQGILTMADNTNAPLFGTVEFFIERNHAKIAGIIRQRLGKQYDRAVHATPEALRLWVLNDHELYTWAVKEGMEP
jgi:hypothetical protein